jgi:hypothetical protein
MNSFTVLFHGIVQKSHCDLALNNYNLFNYGYELAFFQAVLNQISLRQTTFPLFLLFKSLVLLLLINRQRTDVQILCSRPVLHTKCLSQRQDLSIYINTTAYLPKQNKLEAFDSFKKLNKFAFTKFSSFFLLRKYLNI